MTTFNRTYNTLKFLRGKTKNTELERLSEEEKDFEYRRLLIEEREKDLHVTFSREQIFKYISWGLLALCAGSLQFLLLAVIFFVCSVISHIISRYYKRKFSKIFESYNLTMMLVDNVIENMYGILLPKYL